MLLLAFSSVVVLAMVRKVKGGGAWLETNIDVCFNVVLPRVVKVAEVAWFTGGQGPDPQVRDKFLCQFLCCLAMRSEGSRSSMVYGGSGA